MKASSRATADTRWERTLSAIALAPLWERTLSAKKHLPARINAANGSSENRADGLDGYRGQSPLPQVQLPQNSFLHRTLAQHRPKITYAWSRLTLRMAALLLILIAAGCSPPPPEPAATQSLSRTLSTAAAEGFEPITPALKLEFPRDHGAHPRQRIEWWYVTTRVRSTEGRRFGTQLALFRYGLHPENEASREDWQGHQIYMAHLAITDIDGERFFSDEQTARGAAGLAGAGTSPFRVWLGECALASHDSTAMLPLALECAAPGFGYRWQLNGNDRPVLHGSSGYSLKSDASGSASAYYSYPALNVDGQLWIGSERFEAQGQAWYDHEWTSGVLAEDQAGWDWFSLRLSDGNALMLFNIRRKDGSLAARHGSLIGVDGSVRSIGSEELELEATATWTSPKSGVRWPTRWRLHSTALDLELQIAPQIEDQELDGAIRYWEGAIDASGTHAGQKIHAEGYLELTGYEAGS